MLETRGRLSGRPVTTAVGFVEGDAPGTVLVAAGEPDADWALNLLVEPACRATIGEATTDAHATLVTSSAERNRVLSELILKYGTPAERLGRGPVFRLVPHAGGR